MFWPSYGLKNLANDSIFSDPLHGINSDIPILRHAVSTLPRACPMRIQCIQALALELNMRYRWLGEVDDLEQSILLFTEAIFLLPPLNGRCPNIVRNFFWTAQLLHLRAVHTELPEDARCPVIYLRYLLGQSPEAFNISLDEVKEYLARALAFQSRLGLATGSGDVKQDIEEMADLVLELLNSDIWRISTDTIDWFVRVVILRHRRWGLEEGKEPPAKVISCLRKMKFRLPDWDNLSVALASTLLDRFRVTYLNDDYEEGTAILDEFLTSHAPEDEPTGILYRHALMAITVFSQLRFNGSWKPEHLQEAIRRCQNLIAGTHPEDPYHLPVAHHLKFLQSVHFEDFGVGGVQEEYSPDSRFSGQTSFWDLITSLESPSMATGDQRHAALVSASRLTDPAEIEKAIEPCRLLLASFHPSEIYKPIAIGTLHHLLLRAFHFTNNIEYVNEAISISRDCLSMPDALNLGELISLIDTLSMRFNLCHSREDLGEIMRLYKMAVDHKGMKIPDRLRYSCKWAQLARIHSHPSTSTAYHYALSSMQDSLTFAPTVDIQHYRLVAMRNNYETLPLDCASYQVHTSQLKSAVETLERGRALIWSEMRGLRSSIEQLRTSDPGVADKLAAMSQDLEDLTLTFAQNKYGDGREEGLEGMGPFGRLVVQQRGLLDEREKLISQIRARKGLESFLKPPSFDNLRSAAVRGPVVMVNHCRWRSDIIILLRDSPPSLIPTANDFYDRANKLRDQLLGARKKGLESVEYENALRSVLKELYELVGRPVIQKLNDLGVPEQSRVWWCPTSAFCFLPLHAMGPIPSDSGPPRYFLDLYIPSYTPTLSALIESNKSGPQMSGKPSLLLVSQPDSSLEDALDEMHVVQSINTKVKTLSSASAAPTAVLKHLRDHRFVHIVCHGILEPGKPFDSSFKLYRDNRLTLLDIIRSRLPDAEFAFLAACHTAELTDGSLSDEALHLTAAMQYCGFRSVVGTMWAMADPDGRELSRNFYKSVFPAGEDQGVRYYERVAEALRDAVIKLRRRKGIGMTLERWVNFVHYGA